MVENGLEGRVTTWMGKDLGAGQKRDRQEWIEGQILWAGKDQMVLGGGVAA